MPYFFIQKLSAAVQVGCCAYCGSGCGWRRVLLLVVVPPLPPLLCLALWLRPFPFPALNVPPSPATPAQGPKKLYPPVTGFQVLSEVGECPQHCA